MLRRLPVRIDTTPCWGLRRRLAALRPAAIPDLLALRLGAEEATEAAIAIEVDLGGERLKNVFVPKLAVLRETLAGWASGQPAAVGRGGVCGDSDGVWFLDWAKLAWVDARPEEGRLSTCGSVRR